MKPDSSLADIREQVVLSRLAHVPTDFCFLYNGHPLDPNVEVSIRASNVAVAHESQFIVLIDNVHCNIGPKTLVIRTLGVSAPATALIAASGLVLSVLGLALVALYRDRHAGAGRDRQYYNAVPVGPGEGQALIERSGSEPATDGPPEQCFQHGRALFRAVARPPPLFKSRAAAKSHAVQLGGVPPQYDFGRSPDSLSV